MGKKFDPGKWSLSGTIWENKDVTLLAKKTSNNSSSLGQVNFEMSANFCAIIILKNQKYTISWHLHWKSGHYLAENFSDSFQPGSHNVIFCIQCTPSLRLRLYLAKEAKSASANLLLVLEANGGFPPPQGLVSARPYSSPAFACCWCCSCFLVAQTKDDLCRLLNIQSCRSLLKPTFFSHREPAVQRNQILKLYNHCPRCFCNLE